MAIFSHFHKTKNQKVKRRQMLRKKAFSTNVNSLATKKYLKKEYKRFAHEHFNKDQLREI